MVHQHIIVSSETITVSVNGNQVVRWTQPADGTRPREGEELPVGDDSPVPDPNSAVYYKNTGSPLVGVTLSVPDVDRSHARVDPVAPPGSDSIHPRTGSPTRHALCRAHQLIVVH